MRSSTPRRIRPRKSERSLRSSPMRSRGSRSSCGRPSRRKKMSSREEPGEVEATEDTETRERRELRSKARVSDFLTSALTGRPVTGASGEYADAVGVPGFMPLDLLETPGAAFIDVARFPEVEKRDVTPGPADDTVTATQPTVPFAFARTDAAALGIAYADWSHLARRTTRR